MDPEQLALLMALRGGQGFPATATPPFTAPAGVTWTGPYMGGTPGPMSVPPPTPAADPRAQWESILFGQPPQPQEPGWDTMGKAGRIGLILSALGDVANVLQRRSAKGARTFRPSNYTGEYMEGQRGRAQERYGQTLRADATRRQEANYRLGRLDAQEAEQRAVAREEQRRAMDDARNLRELQEAANMPGATRAEIMMKRSQMDQEEKNYLRRRQSEADERAATAEKNAAAYLELAKASAAREKERMAQEDKVGPRQIENEQRDLLRKAMSTIGRAKRALTTGESFTEIGKPAEMDPKDLRRAMLQLAERMGLDQARTTAFMRQVDLELFKQRGISPERAGARFDLFIPPKGMDKQYMSPDGSQFSDEPKTGWIDTQTGERLGRAR